MSNEINDFISELKKTRDYSSFAPKGHEGKTSKKVEKVESVENTLTHHSDRNQQAVQQVQEEPSIISTILKEDSTQGQAHLVGLNESSIKPIETIEAFNLERITLAQSDKPMPIKVKKEKTHSGSEALNGESCVYEPFKMSPSFIGAVNEAHVNDNFNYTHHKRFEVDNNMHEILMQLKHHGQIKSVSTLINVILSDFIKDNKEALQTLFAASSNRINF
jgi:hypothetical protein